MRWSVDVGELVSEVRWSDGELTGPAPLVEDVERFAARHAGDLLAPIPCTSIPVGLADPLEAWATVTAALSEDRPMGSVRTPRPPVRLGPDRADVVF